MIYEDPNGPIAWILKWIIILSFSLFLILILIKAITNSIIKVRSHN